MTSNPFGKVNFYQVLGLDKSATKPQIRAAYLAGARAYHPDKNQTEQDGERFAFLSIAYRTLIDPNVRAVYDESYLHPTKAAEEFTTIEGPLYFRDMEYQSRYAGRGAMQVCLFIYR